MDNLSGKVVVITLNYNQNQFTLECVKSILESDFGNFEVLLIDNGSTSQNQKELEKLLPFDPRLILHVITPNRGYVGGINYSLDLCKVQDSDYVLIMNNDTLIDKEAIGELVKTCKKHHDEAIVSGKVYHYDRPSVIQDIGYSFTNEKYLNCRQIGLDEADTGQYDEEVERDLLDDVFWLFPFKLYKEIGGYSKYFWFDYEQADFALRAKKIGYKLIYTPHAKIWHKGSPSVGGRILNPVQAYYSMQGALIYRYLHLSRWNFVKYYIKTGTGILGSFLKWFLGVKTGSGRLKYNVAKLKGFAYFNRWIVRKNENTGENPFITDNK
ncbi:MAG: glycosyltransferase [Prolixibacteraceae bacterium]|nr:glycosyltransferase [Prolixibacteraceae bacterium]